MATLNVGISSTASPYTVVLDARPTAAVTVTPSSNAEAKATVSGALTFATDSWDTAQTVMVTGVAAGSATVSHGVVSTDSDYSGITVSGVSVTVPSRTLVASSITDTTATLTIGNYTGDWYYKYTSPTGGVCSTTASDRHDGVFERFDGGDELHVQCLQRQWLHDGDCDGGGVHDFVDAWRDGVCGHFECRH